MSLSNARVAELLSGKFVCGWKDISGAEFAGESRSHSCAGHAQAKDVNNGSGFHNVQMIMLTPDGRVVHCLAGYWKPEALARELEFALELVALWQNDQLARLEKIDRFTEAHLSHMKSHGEEVIRQSDLPDFDQRIEKRKKGDTCRQGGEVKKADQIVHERMAERPFLPFEKFDLKEFVAVGDRYYDAGGDGCNR